MPESAALTRLARSAMACEFEVILNTGQFPHGIAAGMEALDCVTALEDQLSVFREGSELCYINRTASARPVPVDPLLWNLLQQCLEIGAEMEGALDLTTAPLWRLWGFQRRQGRLPTPQEIDLARSRVGGHHLRLEAENQTVQFLNPGLELNLGAVGKGYALDRAAIRLEETGVQDFLMHAGGSSVVARGSQGVSSSAAWRIDLPHPWRTGDRLASFHLKDQALATSGSAEQCFFHQGVRYSHIIDPRTGWPAQGLISVTAICRQGSLAEALSTAFFVLGVDGIGRYCARHPDVAALAVRPGSRAGLTELVPFNLPSDGWESSADDVHVVRDVN